MILLRTNRVHGMVALKRGAAKRPLSTFVQPEVLPSGISHQVPGPAVRNLMRDHANLGAVPGQPGGGDKGESGVLHTPIGEGGG